MRITRKQFLSSSLSLIGAAAGLSALPACGGDDEGGGYGSGGSAGSAAGGAAGRPTAGSGGGGGAPAGSGGGGGAPASNCDASMISGNHGHAVTVPRADVDAGGDRTYTLTTGAGHTHELSVTAADFALLAGGKAVTITSTTVSQHSHDVTILCA